MTFKQKHFALNLFLLFVYCSSDRSELRAAAFLSSCKNSLGHLYNLYNLSAGDSFQCAAKTMHVVQVVQTEFFSCVWCTFFLPFHLFICSCKVQKQSSCKYWKVQAALLVPQYKEPARIGFLSLTLARPFLQWNAALPWGGGQKKRFLSGIARIT